MNYNLSACVFIRNTFEGAFCIFESMATLLPLADEFIVMDLGSTDGTYETLLEIADVNPKVNVVQGEFSKIDANVFATLANDLISLCSNQNVLYYQADEIWHENLVSLMRQEFDQGNFDLKFWRVQLRENFQKIKWFPHFVHRVGQKGNFNFVGDGMNTDRYFEPKLCYSAHDSGWFPKWSTVFEHNPELLPLKEMILDVSLVGAFLENIPERRRMHTPFWNEPITSMPADEDGLSIDEWMTRERGNLNWDKLTTPFNIPSIMEWHLGKKRYTLRPELLEALKDNVEFGEVERWR